ncbi:MAG: hypothetical protein AAF488_17805, partial [Planctomycetota bacterium]
MAAGGLDQDGLIEWRRVEDLGLGPVKLHTGLVDSRGQLWFRLDTGGLALVDLSSDRWRRIPGLEGPPYPRILSLYETSLGERVVGCANGLLVYSESSEDPSQAKFFTNEAGQSIRDVSAVGEEVRGRDSSRVWIGSESTPGLLFFDSSRPSRDAGEPTRRWGRVQLSQTIHRIVRDARGDLWFLAGSAVGARNTVFRIARFGVGRPPEPVALTSVVPGFSPRSLEINDLERVSGEVEDSFWLATEDGLLKARFDEETLIVEKRISVDDGLVSSRVWAVSSGPDQSLWICYPSSGRGVTRIRGESIAHFDVEQGLAGPEVLSIARSGSNLWFGTNAGLTRFDGEIWYSFPIESGGAHSSWVIPLLVPSDSLGGTLLVGTAERGLLRFQSDDQRRPRIRKLSFPAEVLSGEPVTFRWRARDYKNQTLPGELIFHYRLDGGPWKQRQGISELTFEDLALGDHTFELEVRDLDGNRTRTYQERLHDFVVLPGPHYWPQVAGLISISIAGISVFVIWRRRRVKRFRKLELYRSFFRSLPHPMLVIDRSQRVVAYNGVAPELLGIEPDHVDELIGRPANWVPHLTAFCGARRIDDARGGATVHWRGVVGSGGPSGEACVEIRAFPLQSAVHSEGESVAVLVEDVTRDEDFGQLESRERRLRGLREFASRLSADLVPLERHLEAIRDRGPSFPLDPELATLIQSWGRIESVLKRIHAFADPGQQNAAALELDSVLDELLARTTATSRCELDYRSQTGLWSVRASRPVLDAAFGAVLENAP